MKRYISTVLLAALLLSFAACSGAGKDSGTDTAATADRMTSAATTAAETTAAETTSAITTAEATVTTETELITTAEPVIEAPVTESIINPTYPTNVYTPEELATFDTTHNGWGQGVHVDELNRPTGATWAQGLYGHRGAVFIMPETDPVRLTFDLGYENGYTEPIIDALNEKGVKGTFFVTMHYVTSAPHIVQRIVDEGHILANHSVDHRSMPSLTVAEMEAEIMGLHDYVLEHFGYEMFLFRPPSGEYSELSLAVAENLGYRSILWSYAYVDYDVNNQPDPAAALEWVNNAVHPGGVYLLHAVSSTNAAIMGDVIDHIVESGIGITWEW